MILREKILMFLACLVLMGLFIDLNTPLGSMLWEAKTGITDRLAIHQNFKIGYINRRGRIVIPPRFEQGISHFRSGLAPVMKKRRWGYINTTGLMVIEPRFRTARPFSEGLAAVAPGESPLSREGFINTRGEYVIEPTYTNTRDFQEGLAAVELNERWGFINHNGLFQIDPIFEEAQSFSQDMAAVKYNGQWGYVDPFGYWDIEPRFDDAGPFAEGLAPVKKDGLWGYINNVGVLVIEYQYDEAAPFAEGLAAVRQGYTTAYINKKNERIIESDRYAEIKNFSEGLARVNIGRGVYNREGKWGYIDKTGAMAIAPRFDWGWDFMAGVARVGLKKNSIKRGYIDREGNWIWNPAQWDKHYFVKNLIKNIVLVFLFLLLLSGYRVHAVKRHKMYFLSHQARKRDGRVIKGRLYDEPVLRYQQQGVNFELYNQTEEKTRPGGEVTIIQAPYPLVNYHHIAFYPKTNPDEYIAPSKAAFMPKLDNPLLQEHFQIEAEDPDVYLNDLLAKEMKQEVLTMRPLDCVFSVHVANRRFRMRFETCFQRHKDFDRVIEIAALFYRRIKELDTEWDEGNRQA